MSYGEFYNFIHIIVKHALLIKVLWCIIKEIPIPSNCRGRPLKHLMTAF